MLISILVTYYITNNHSKSPEIEKCKANLSCEKQIILAHDRIIFKFLKGLGIL